MAPPSPAMKPPTRIGGELGLGGRDGERRRGVLVLAHADDGAADAAAPQPAEEDEHDRQHDERAVVVAAVVHRDVEGTDVAPGQLHGLLAEREDLERKTYACAAMAKASVLAARSRPRDPQRTESRPTSPPRRPPPRPGATPHRRGGPGRDPLSEVEVAPPDVDRHPPHERCRAEGADAGEGHLPE